jgi:hypothetical protein
MNGNPFRRRPFVDVGIDSWKVTVLAVSFLILVIWILIQ